MKEEFSRKWSLWRKKSRGVVRMSKRRKTGRNLLNGAANELNESGNQDKRSQLSKVNKLQQRLAPNRRGNDENGAVKEIIRRQDSR